MLVLLPIMLSTSHPENILQPLVFSESSPISFCFLCDLISAMLPLDMLRCVPPFRNNRNTKPHPIPFNCSPFPSHSYTFPGLCTLVLPTVTSRLFPFVSVSSLSAKTNPTESTDDLLVPDASIFQCLSQLTSQQPLTLLSIASFLHASHGIGTLIYARYHQTLW